MITRDGYSKDPNIVPDGIAVTFGRQMILEKGGLRRFLKWFESCLDHEEGFFYHKCKNRPKTDDLLYVYIIICNRVYYRCIFGGHETGRFAAFRHPGDEFPVWADWPRIVLAGPIVKAPEKIIRGGFQGFRYTTKLF